jgi:hypothetical protein
MKFVIAKSLGIFIVTGGVVGNVGTPELDMFHWPT